jgi:hypothetical protein
MRPTTIAVLVVCVFVSGLLWLREHDARLKERSAAHERIAQDSVKLVEATRELIQARTRHAVADMMARGALALYDSMRVNPVVRRVVLPGEVDTVIVVQKEYVQAADSLRQACGILQLECARFRLAADSTIAAQARMIDNLKIVEGKKGGFSFPTLLLGAAAGLGAAVLIR